MHCPKCNFGMMERVGHTDMYLKSGKLSDRPVHHMKCLKCTHVSKWRREYSGGRNWTFKLQWLDELEGVI